MDGRGSGGRANVPFRKRREDAPGADPGEGLARHPAIDYDLSPQHNHWLMQAVAAATPGLHFLLHRYQRAWLRPDLMAGLAVAAYLIPQVMAYAAIVGVPPVYGLYTALLGLVVYALMGSSRVLSVGPESTIALLAGAAVAGVGAREPGHIIALSAALSLLVAGWLFLARLLRLGVLSDLLSQPLLVGYLAGAAVLMVVGQLGKLTGTEVDGHSIVEQVRSFVEVLGAVHPNTVYVAAATAAFIFLIHAVRPSWPAALIAVTGATIASAVLDLSSRGVAVVGTVPSGVPLPSIPAVSLSQVQALLVPALGVALLAYSDNMLGARAFPSPELPGERPSERAVDPQVELVALGGAHLGVGLFGGFPISSSGSRTALAVSARAHSQLYSLIAAVCAARLAHRRAADGATAPGGPWRRCPLRRDEAHQGRRGAANVALPAPRGAPGRSHPRRDDLAWAARRHRCRHRHQPAGDGSTPGPAQGCRPRAGPRARRHA